MTALRTFGVSVHIPPSWDCSTSDNGSRQRRVIVAAPSATAALRAFNSVLGHRHVTAGYLREYGYPDMGGVAAEVATADPGVVFYAPTDLGRDYVRCPGQDG